MKRSGALLFLALWFVARGVGASLGASAFLERGAGDSVAPGALVQQSLEYHLATNVAARTVGLRPSTETMCELTGWRYSYWTNDAVSLLTNATWSTNFWLHGVYGLSATSIAASNAYGARGMVTLVSPRHYLVATHMHPEGLLLAFKGSNNVVYWRRTLERVDVADDTSVGILDEDLPGTVGFLPVWPGNYPDYIPAFSASPVQGIGMNQNLCLFSQPMAFGRNPTMVLWSATARCPYGASTNWNYTLQSGDSSNPQMVLVRNQLVLVSHAYVVSGGPNYAFQINRINGQMHYLSMHNHVGTDYQLTAFSLAGWPTLMP